MSTPDNMIPAQAGERPNCLVVDMRDGRLWTGNHRADDFGNGPGVPGEVYHGLVRRIFIPQLNYRQANQLMRALSADAATIAAGSTVVHTGSDSRPAMELTPDASAAWSSINARIERLHQAAIEAGVAAERAEAQSRWNITGPQSGRARTAGFRRGYDTALRQLAATQ